MSDEANITPVESSTDAVLEPVTASTETSEEAVKASIVEQIIITGEDGAEQPTPKQEEKVEPAEKVDDKQDTTEIDAIILEKAGITPSAGDEPDSNKVEEAAVAPQATEAADKTPESTEDAKEEKKESQESVNVEPSVTVAVTSADAPEVAKSDVTPDVSATTATDASEPAHPSCTASCGDVTAPPPSADQATPTAGTDQKDGATEQQPQTGSSDAPGVKSEEVSESPVAADSEVDANQNDKPVEVAAHETPAAVEAQA